MIDFCFIIQCILSKKRIHNINDKQSVRAVQASVQLLYLHIHFFFHIGGIELEVVVTHLAYLSTSEFFIVMHVCQTQAGECDWAAVQLHARVEWVHLLQRLTEVGLLLHPRLVSGCAGERPESRDHF